MACNASEDQALGVREGHIGRSGPVASVGVNQMLGERGHVEKRDHDLLSALKPGTNTARGTSKSSLSSLDHWQ